jgi:hypothetical protein
MNRLLVRGEETGFARPRSSRRAAERQAGFNLAEIAVTISVLLTAGAMTTPPLAGLLRRSKVETAVQEASALMRASRSIAITRGTPAVVIADSSTRTLIAFADVHGAGLADDPDGVFNPLPGQPQRTTDYEIGRVVLPAMLDFVDPWSGGGLDSIAGFDNPGTLPDGSAIFLPDGSIASIGAFRFADANGNCLETTAGPRNAVRVDIRKWDGTAWRARGEGGRPWAWN